MIIQLPIFDVCDDYIDKVFLIIKADCSVSLKTFLMYNIDEDTLFEDNSILISYKN